MSKHYSFPSIDQFRQVIRMVRDRAAYHGIPDPTLHFTGSVKLHGTNAGVVREIATGETWAQSREHVITIEKDNAGFARYVQDSAADIDFMFDNAMAYTEHATHIAIYGEWCGQGIQRGVAISQLPKRFVIFGVRMIADTGEGEPIRKWLTKQQVVEIASGGIASIYEFPTFDVTIDFARPELAQNELIRITNEVEARCPYAARFGVDGIGEGVVWMPADDAEWVNLNDLIFKVKGEKHSDSKVKTVAEVDVQKVANMHAFAECVVTNHRMEKMIDKLKEAGLPVEITSIGAFLKHACGDVMKEESDRLTASGLEWKEVAGTVNKAAKQWFMKRLDEQAFG